MILKYTSSKEVIAKIFSDLDLQEEMHRIVDFKEWISEGLEKIGAVTQYTRKISGIDGAPILTVTNYQAALPTNLTRVEQVAFSFTENGIYNPMRYNTGTMGMQPLEAKLLPEYSATQHYYPGNKVQYMATDPTTGEQRLEIFICKKEHNATGTSPVRPDTIPNDSWILYVPYSDLTVSDFMLPHLEYYLKPISNSDTKDYIVTNVKDGFIKMCYDVYNLDEDGYPLVPDIASYKEALYWYVTMKLKYPEYLRGSLNRDVFYDIRRSWNFYRQQAYAEALMPNNADEMESIKNTWLRMFPEMNMTHSSLH